MHVVIGTETRSVLESFGWDLVCASTVFSFFFSEDLIDDLIDDLRSRTECLERDLAVF